MLRALIFSALAGLLLAACAAAPERLVADLQSPTATNQVVLVTTADWDATAATLSRLERTATGWRRVGEAIAAQVGRSGLGWGIGRHQDGKGPQKQEGDGRAPAGIFELGPAFGYASDPPAGLTIPYRTATARDYFVDAADSPNYNQWQRIPDGEANDPNRRWRSFERMRRDDHQYEFGMVVGHNTKERIPGRGSAIFLHVWSAPGNPTSGCTAMSKPDLLRLLTWLSADAEPVLIQVPRSELPGLRRHAAGR